MKEVYIMSYSAAFSQAVEIVLYIGIKMENGHTKYLSIKSISEKLNIPVPSIKRLVGMLKNEGIIISKTGSSGGLILARDTKNISLFDIFRAIEGDKRTLFNFCGNFDLSQFKSSEDVKKQINQLKFTLDEAETAMLNVLKNKSIYEIMKH